MEAAGCCLLNVREGEPEKESVCVRVCVRRERVWALRCACNHDSVCVSIREERLLTLDDVEPALVQTVTYSAMLSDC
jgi:hypothetical protein